MFALKNLALTAIVTGALGLGATAAHADTYYVANGVTYVVLTQPAAPVYLAAQPQVVVVAQPVCPPPVVVCQPAPPVIYHPYDRDHDRFQDRDRGHDWGRDDRGVRVGFHW